MEPTVFQIEGTRFGKVERWPLWFTTPELAREEKDRLRATMDYSWMFEVVEKKTDA